MLKIKVRWLDGFQKDYEAAEYQMGQHNYWIKLTDTREKWIPRENVRHVTISESELKAGVVGRREGE